MGNVDETQRDAEAVQEVSQEASEGSAGRAEGSDDSAGDAAKDNVVKLGDAREAPRIEVTQETKAMAQSLRILADKCESGELGNLDFLVIIPKRVDGEMPMLYMGKPIPNVMLEGMLHRMLTKMALQS